MVGKTYTPEEISNLVQPVSTVHQRIDPDPRYFGSRDFCFIPALHNNQETLNAVDSANVKTFKVVIVEGIYTNLGDSPNDMIKHSYDEQERVRKKNEKNPSGKPLVLDEASYAIIQASENGVKFIGGEPTNKEILEKTKDGHYKYKNFPDGVSSTDLLNHDILGGIPAGIRDGKIKNEADIDDYINNKIHDMNKNLPDNPGADELSLKGFKNWYDKNKIVNKNLIDLSPEALGPSDDPKAGKFRNLSALTERARDEHLLELISKESNENGNKVLVIYGNSHFKCLENGLSKMIGEELPLCGKTQYPVSSEGPSLSAPMQNAIKEFLNPAFQISTINIPPNALDKTKTLEK